MRAMTLLNYNFKGGVGKTTLTGLQAYLLAKKGKKVLLLDFDPQSNLTEMMHQTYNVDLKHPAVNLYEGMKRRDLSDTLVHVSKNIDMFPGDWDLNDLVDDLATTKKPNRWMFLNDMLAPYKDKYDFIFIDVPPTLNDMVINAIFAADGISIVLQTQAMAYYSALKTVQKLGEFRAKYHPKFQVLGVVLYLFSKAKIDNEVINKSKKMFGKWLFNDPIKYQERIKGFTAHGIKDEDHWDKRAIGNYSKVNDDIISAAKKALKNG